MRHTSELFIYLLMVSTIFGSLFHLAAFVGFRFDSFSVHIIFIHTTTRVRLVFIFILLFWVAMLYLLFQQGVRFWEFEEGQSVPF